MDVQIHGGFTRDSLAGRSPATGATPSGGMLVHSITCGQRRGGDKTRREAEREAGEMERRSVTWLLFVSVVSERKGADVLQASSFLCSPGESRHNPIRSSMRIFPGKLNTRGSVDFFLFCFVFCRSYQCAANRRLGLLDAT